MRLTIRLAAAFAAVTIAQACSQDEPSTPAAAIQTPTGTSAIAEVNSAVAAHDYGRALQLASAAATTYPDDPAVHLVHAQAEARMSNAGNSAAAFQRAIETGLATPVDALADATFNGVRATPAFATIRTSLASAGRPSAKVSAAVTRPPAQPREHIRAGDVEIIREGGEEYIRAGDLTLSSRD